MTQIPGNASLRRSWVVGLCSVLFDVDIGPRVDNLVPEGVLTTEEKQDIAFHAFPDSMSMELHARSTIRDSCFFFRIRRRGSLKTQHPASDAVSAGSDDASMTQPAVSCDTADDRFLYGFVFCRQRQDASLRRGGEQLSVAVLSDHPFSSVLRPLSQVAGPAFFSHGKAALEQLYQEACSWPAPVSGPLLQLQAGLTTIQARLPSMQTLPHPSTAIEPDVVSLSRSSTLHSHRSSITFGGSLNRSTSYATDGLPPAASDHSDRGLSGELNSGSFAFDAPAGHSGSPSKPPLPRKPSESQSRDNPGTAGGGSSLPLRVLPNRQGSTGSSTSLPSGTSLPNSIGHLHLGHGANSSTFQGPASPDRHTGFNNPPGALASLASTSSLGSLDGADASHIGRAGSQGQPLYRRTSLQSHSHSNGLESQGSASQGAFCEVDIYTALNAHLHRLWQLWEMVLLGEPLLVVGMSPGDCCQATAALISLVAPLPFRHDYRPYYTIHDTSFKDLATGRMPTAEDNSLPSLLGVTNLYFLKALSHWPNVLSVGRKEPSTWTGAAAGAAVAAAAAVLNPGAAVRALRQRTRGAQSLLAAHSEALWSSFRPLTRPDETLLARLLKPQAGDVRSKLARIAVVNNEAIRRHFHELTTALLAPFGRYSEVGPDGFVPRWDAASFLATLPSIQHAALLTDRFGRASDVSELFSRFVASANFRAWMALRQQAVEQLLAPEPLPEGLLVGPDGRPLEEVQLVELFFETELLLQEKQAQADLHDTSQDAKQEVIRLRRYLASLFFGMPEDLQWTCISSPVRRQMLASLQAELNSEQQQQLQRLVARLK